MTKILLVDDVPLSVDMQKSALSRAECEIFTAHSGKDAMEIVYRESPDLIVLDYFMPEMSGDVCCRKIKSDDSLKDTPVIMLTMEGTDADQDKAKCYAAGCDDFLTKPFKANDFLKKVEKYLDITVREY
ncbi:MAG: response regulator, partial [Proteobacteria bacterium]|nr:response regulator [Pseudomonadota bacterium]